MMGHNGDVILSTYIYMNILLIKITFSFQLYFSIQNLAFFIVIDIYYYYCYDYCCYYCYWRTWTPTHLMAYNTGPLCSAEGLIAPFDNNNKIIMFSLLVLYFYAVMVIITHLSQPSHMLLGIGDLLLKLCSIKF